MKKVLIVDKNGGFRSDIESRAIIFDLDNIDISTTGEVERIGDVAKQRGANEILVAANLLNAYPDWGSLGIPVKCYAKQQSELFAAASLGIPCYGILQTTTDILNAVKNGRLMNLKPPSQAQDVGNTEVQSSSVAAGRKQARTQENTEYQSPTYPNQNTGPINENGQSSWVAPPGNGAGTNAGTGTVGNPYASPLTDPSSMNVSTQTWNEQSYGQSQMGTPQSFVQPQTGMQPPFQSQTMPPFQGVTSGYSGATTDYQGYLGQTPNSTVNGNPQAGSWNMNRQYGQSFQEERMPLEYGNYGTSYGGGYQNAEQYHQPYQQDRRMPQQSYCGGQNNAGNWQAQNDAYAAVERDMGIGKKKAKVITVYSAKGGVGKTTIACELATYLALTAHGRGKFRVCIADYNIDFGDVISTLNFDPDKMNMCTWAEDIRGRIMSGESPNQIQYSQAQIESWIQQNPSDGLYGLIAPLTNADSMKIGEAELKVMMNNLIYNGGFDFVIFDTGNNTRDSSFITLENADEILLVITQNIATANCNASFLDAFASMGYDLNRINLVINKIRPGKSVGLSVQELEEACINPYTKMPYPCIGKIKDSNDVRSAGNLTQPLVYNSSHIFTKSIGAIATALIGDTHVLEAPEKKGLFGRRKKKRR